jgi:antitoxin CptB
MIDDRRIRWRCRRGMKELDVMLERFLADGYSELDEGERAVFARLLNSMDPELFGWLSGNALPDDEQLAAVVRRVRRTLGRVD